MRKIGSLSAALLLALSAGPVGAQVYKWVDSDGVTHYSQQPPESGGAREMAVPAPAVESAPESKPATPPAGSTTEDRKATELSNDIRARRAEDDRQQADADAKRKTACEQVRQNLKTLRSHSRVRVQENDSTRVLTPEEQAQQIVQLEKQLRDSCEPAQ